MRTRLPLLTSLALAVALIASGCALLPSPSDGAEIIEDDDFGTVAVYRVDADGMLEPTASGSSARIWDMFLDIVTAPVAGAEFDRYLVGDAPASDTLAFVTRNEDDPSLRTLAANAAFADDEDELRQTLIHEYAHVLSLNVRQVPEGTGACATLELSEGCAIPTANLYAFQQEFWDAYGPDAPAPDNDDVEIADAFYERHENEFVSAYAATNVAEDFAESFAAFVQEDEPDADSPVAAKLRFFWGVPEYVAFRAHVRERFGLD